MQANMTFQVKVKGQAMTPAERQRACRARGKGRHRGGLTAAQRAAIRQRNREELAALEVAMVASAAATATVPLPTPTPEP